MVFGVNLLRDSFALCSGNRCDSLLHFGAEYYYYYFQTLLCLAFQEFLRRHSSVVNNGE